MATSTSGGPSVGRVVLVAVVVSALVGFGTGYLAGIVLQPAAPAPATREFYVFTAVRQFNETEVGTLPDAFSPDTIVVNKGDTVRIHFYNAEEVASQEAHTFTMDAPYQMNYDRQAGTNVTFSFVAGTSGIFRYYCIYHQPVMFGYLIVK